MLKRDEILVEIDRYAGNAHDPKIVQAWDTIDTYYKREAAIELPEAVSGETGDGASLRRLFIRTNFAKTIVNSTVTMAMASGIKVFGADGLPDRRSEALFQPTDVRKVLRYMSRYGAAWIHVIVDDAVKPYRVYRPHVARRIMRQEDPEREHAVVAIQNFKRPGADGIDEEYSVARWYEWDDRQAKVVLQTFVKDARLGADWLPRLGDDGTRSFAYMPFVYVPNREEDTIPEQSDIYDGIDIFKQYDALRVKFLKALEDESFRLIFLSQVGDEQAKAIQRAGGLQLWYAKNRAGEAPPELQSVPPADQRQFLDAMSDLVDSLATVTRTSVLELNERPVQDIPAQTLQVLYGPQIERCKETVEHLNPAITQVLNLVNAAEGGGRRAVLEPNLPISEEKLHQNRKGLLDSNAYSITQMLIDGGKTPEEAEKIFEQRLAELRKIRDVEVEGEVRVAEAAAAARPTPGGA